MYPSNLLRVHRCRRLVCNFYLVLMSSWWCIHIIIEANWNNYKVTSDRLRVVTIFLIDRALRLTCILGLRSWAMDPMGKCDTPSSSRLLFRLQMDSPCLSELDRLNSMSSTTRRELDRARRALPTVGLSGRDRLLALVVTNGGGLVMNGGNAMLDPLLEPPKPSCPMVELKLMLDFLRLLCLSNVFWAENGLGRRMYLKYKKRPFQRNPIGGSSWIRIWNKHKL